mmetsp:Transcript_5842/g.19900  ORF Transcript_5842/g.19900 Transcript_5842/m.19900 type:complete len:220 (-) Transcript_5842:16-675(-)
MSLSIGEPAMETGMEPAALPISSGWASMPPRMEPPCIDPPCIELSREKFSSTFSPARHCCSIFQQGYASSTTGKRPRNRSTCAHPSQGTVGSIVLETSGLPKSWIRPAAVEAMPEIRPNDWNPNVCAAKEKKVEKTSWRPTGNSTNSTMYGPGRGTRKRSPYTIDRRVTVTNATLGRLRIYPENPVAVQSIMGRNPRGRMMLNESASLEARAGSKKCSS